jgi:hypothetical protein
MCQTHDWLNRPRDFDLRKFPPEVFCKLVGHRAVFLLGEVPSCGLVGIS